MYANSGLATSSSNVQGTGPLFSRPPASQDTTDHSNSVDANLAALESAKRAVQAHLSKDDVAVPELSSVIEGQNASSTYSNARNEAWIPFIQQKRIALPQQILDDYGFANPHSTMGILPDIDRVWITMDERLYLWDYIEGGPSSFEVYQKDDEIITHVALVPAKRGIFVDAITHVLVLCRKMSLTLVGISAPPGPATAGTQRRRELTIFETDIKVPTANQEMLSVVGTPEGRILMCGASDGAIFELEYQAKESWWSGGRASLKQRTGSSVGNILPSLFASNTSDDITNLTFDNSRRCLYALTSSYTIIMYHLSRDSPTTVREIYRMSNIAMQAQTRCPGAPVLEPKVFKITEIHAVDHSESQDITLVALTAHGVRLYFNHRSYYRPASSGDSAPSTLNLCHVRLPPTDILDPFSDPHSINPQTGQLNQPQRWTVRGAGYAAYESGLFVATQNIENNDDILLCTAPDLPQIGNFKAAGQDGNMQQQQQSSMSKPPLTEIAHLLPVMGSVWSVKPNPAIPAVSKASGWNETITQFSGPAPSFLVLTNDGLHVITRKRPVHTIWELLERWMRTRDTTELNDFYNAYGALQTSVMALAVAADNFYISPSDSLYSPVALDAVLNGSAMTISPLSSGVKETAKLYYSENGGRPTIVEPNAYGGGTTTRYSMRYESLASYFSRLVRPLWKAKITTATLVSNISPANLMSVKRDLERLKAFLTSNPQFFLPGPSAFGSGPGIGASQEAWRAEGIAATQLQTLMNQTIEAISFILLLSDYNMPVVVGKMDLALQQALAQLTYEDFLTTKSGRDTARSLVNAVINQQISQQVSVDAISETLQARCSSFCSADDVMLYKAQEQVRKAKELHPGRERISALEESLRLFEKGAKNMSLSRLQGICRDYQELNFGYGLVSLPLKCAQAWDIDGLGEAYFNDGCPPNDARAGSLERRQACYQCIVDALKELETATDTATTAGQEQKAQDLGAALEYAVRIGLRSQDFVFHSFLYDWLLSKDDPGAMVELASESRFVEQYLLHEPKTQQKAELLWQLYVRNGRSMEAARTLADLAESTPYGLTLDQRIQYLSLAISNAKSTSGDGLRRYEADGEFLKDTEDKLDVATIQIEIYSRLVPMVANPDEDPKVQDLASRLMTLQELFLEYAEPYDMHDMKLLMLHTSEHDDPTLVISIWGAIFDSFRDRPDHFIALGSRVSELGRRFYPSEIAFPIDVLSEALETYALESGAQAPPGWALRVLADGNVPNELVLDYFDRIRESGVPPYQDPAAIRRVLDDITYFLGEWLDEALRPGSRYTRASFPAGKVEALVDRYLSLLRAAGEDQTKSRLLDIQSKVRSRF
ncbi:hypothetical protein FRB94_011063 [Tulasnella sp. JGI-2019a]|nr:hypothetical protein FRB94_011063 [Tulasnella sp. JGI-2019a]